MLLLRLAVKVLREGFDSNHLPISTSFYSSPPMAQNTESNWFSYRDWKNVWSESFSKVCDEMLSKINVPFHFLCDRAVLPLNKKNISVELTSYLTQINHVLNEASFLFDVFVKRLCWKIGKKKNRDLANAYNSAKQWLSIWNKCGRPRDGLVNDLRLRTKWKFNKEQKIIS